MVLAVDILDRFIGTKQEEQICLSLKDLHLYGLTSILVSSKINDIVPIFLKDIVDSAAHGAFTYDIIKSAEYEILKTLQFKLNRNA